MFDYHRVFGLKISKLQEFIKLLYWVEYKEEIGDGVTVAWTRV